MEVKKNVKQIFLIQIFGAWSPEHVLNFKNLAQILKNISSEKNLFINYFDQ